MYDFCVGFEFGSDTTNGLGCTILVSDLTLDPTQMVGDVLSLCRI